MDQGTRSKEQRAKSKEQKPNLGVKSTALSIRGPRYTQPEATSCSSKRTRHRAGLVATNLDPH